MSQDTLLADLMRDAVGGHVPAVRLDSIEPRVRRQRRNQALSVAATTVGVCAGVGLLASQGLGAASTKPTIPAAGTDGHSLGVLIPLIKVIVSLAAVVLVALIAQLVRQPVLKLFFLGFTRFATVLGAVATVVSAAVLQAADQVTNGGPDPLTALTYLLISLSTTVMMWWASDRLSAPVEDARPSWSSRLIVATVGGGAGFATVGPQTTSLLGGRTWVWSGLIGIAALAGALLIVAVSGARRVSLRWRYALSNSLLVAGLSLIAAALAAAANPDPVALTSALGSGALLVLVAAFAISSTRRTLTRDALVVVIPCVLWAGSRYISTSTKTESWIIRLLLLAAAAGLVAVAFEWSRREAYAQTSNPFDSGQGGHGSGQAGSDGFIPSQRKPLGSAWMRVFALGVSRAGTAVALPAAASAAVLFVSSAQSADSAGQSGSAPGLTLAQLYQTLGQFVAASALAMFLWWFGDRLAAPVEKARVWWLDRLLVALGGGFLTYAVPDVSANLFAAHSADVSVVAVLPAGNWARVAIAGIALVTLLVLVGMRWRPGLISNGVRYTVSRLLALPGFLMAIGTPFDLLRATSSLERQISGLVMLTGVLFLIAAFVISPSRRNLLRDGATTVLPLLVVASTMMRRPATNLTVGTDLLPQWITLLIVGLLLGGLIALAFEWRRREAFVNRLAAGPDSFDSDQNGSSDQADSDSPIPSPRKAMGVLRGIAIGVFGTLFLCVVLMGINSVLRDTSMGTLSSVALLVSLGALLAPLIVGMVLATGSHSSNRRRLGLGMVLGWTLLLILGGVGIWIGSGLD